MHFPSLAHISAGRKEGKKERKGSVASLAEAYLPVNREIAAEEEKEEAFTQCPSGV